MLMHTLIKKAWHVVGSRTDIPLKVVLLDGSTYTNSKKAPKFTIIYKTRMGYVRSLVHADVGIAEAYIYGDLDIEGDISALVLMGDEISKSKSSRIPHPINALRNQWHELRFSNRRLAQAKKNALYHYNLGTEMFRNYLDPTMTYTCAYWKEGTKDLAEAQQNKIDHSLKKLRLQKGETLVDVGAGWGSVLLRAHELYGVHGVALSPTPDQNAALKKEIKKRRLTKHVRIKEIDFREDTGLYDKYISLGVYEHAGRGQLEDWIRVMSNTLKPGGIGMLHFIGNINGGLEGTGIFIRKHVFPGGYLPGIGETVSLMDKYDLEVLDIENLRRHYAKTLRAWASNFDANWEVIHALDPQKYDEEFRRRWRFYLYACSAVFLKQHTKNNIGLYQIVFSKGKTTSYPMSREFLYR